MKSPRLIAVRRPDRAPWRRLAGAGPLLIGLLAGAGTASAAPPQAAVPGPAGDRPAPKHRAASAGKPGRVEMPTCATVDAGIDAATTPEELHRRGRCEELDGHLVAALELFEIALRHHPGATLTRQLQARTSLLIRRLGSLHIDASAWPIGARVRVGTRVLAGERLWVDPGRVEITVAAADFEDTSLVIDVATGEEKAVALPAPRRPAPDSGEPSGAMIGPARLPSLPASSRAPVAPEDESILRPLGYVGLAMGGAALIAGGVTGLLAFERGAVIRSECPTPSSCSARGAAAARAGASFSTVSNVTLTSGAVIALGALALVIFGAPKPRPVTVAGYVFGGG